MDDLSSAAKFSRSSVVELSLNLFAARIVITVITRLLRKLLLRLLRRINNALESTRGYLFTIPLTADRAFHCSVCLPLTLPPNLLKSADLNCICVLNKLGIPFPDPSRLIVKFDLCHFQNGFAFRV